MNLEYISTAGIRRESGLGIHFDVQWGGFHGMKIGNGRDSARRGFWPTSKVWRMGDRN
jgi:hypothetical protein